MGDETRLLPDDCARAYGQARSVPMHAAPGEVCFSGPHEAARALHGWGRDDDPCCGGDALHALPSERLRLTRTDYEAALQAPRDCDARGVPRPHLPAMSPHAYGFAAAQAAALAATKPITPPQKAAAKPGKDGNE